MPIRHDFDATYPLVALVEPGSKPNSIKTFYATALGGEDTFVGCLVLFSTLEKAGEYYQLNKIAVGRRGSRYAISNDRELVTILDLVRRANVKFVAIDPPSQFGAEVTDFPIDEVIKQLKAR